MRKFFFSPVLNISRDKKGTVYMNPIQSVGAAYSGFYFKGAVYKEKQIKGAVARRDNAVSGFRYSESLTDRYHNVGKYGGCHSIEGYINENDVFIKQDKFRTGLTSWNSTYSGRMGRENLKLVVNESNGDNIGTIKGKIGNKDVDLTFDFGGGILNETYIKGTVGGKTVNVFPGADEKNSCGENDILTLIASLRGKTLEVKDGKFGEFGISQQASRQNDRDLLIAAVANRYGIG